MHTRISRGNLIITIPLYRVETRRHKLPDGSPVLTERQKQVFHLMKDGRVAKEVAQALNITVRTAKFHMGRIYQRCRVHDRNEFMRSFK